MPIVKICPRCKTENASYEMICVDTNCECDISAILQTDTDAVCREESVLLLICNDMEIEISDGEILGRNFFLDKYPKYHDKIPKTVSRQHAKFTKCDSGWAVEDTDSTNGTWINDKKLTPSDKSNIATGDIICLSRSFKIEVR